MSTRGKHRGEEPMVAAMDVAPAAETTGDVLSSASRWPAAIDPAHVARSIRTRWNLVVAVALITTGLAWTLAMLQPRRYRAETVVAVVPASGIEPDQVFRGVEVLQYRTVVATLAALATTGTAAQTVMATGGNGYQISAFVLPHADLLRIEVEGPDAVHAAAIANRLPLLLSDEARSLYRFYSVRAVAPATVPQDSQTPRTARAIVAGALIGLLIGAAAAAAHGRMRTT